METSTLIGYINQPETLKGAAVEEVRAFTERYPYFAIGQALLAIAYQNENHPGYEQQLRLAASIMPNRDKLRLFSLIAKRRIENCQREPQLPDEFRPKDEFFTSAEVIDVAEEANDGAIIHEKVFIIPEIDLSGSHEELSAEMALLEEKRKSLDELKKIYSQALEIPEIAGIVIGTRPDCIDEEKLDYFAELQKEKFVSIEYGIESCNNRTLQRINRGHTFEQAATAIEMTHCRGIFTGGHLIFGLPGETVRDWFEQQKLLNALPLDSIKFHQLQIIKGTAMEKEYQEKNTDFHNFTMDTYLQFIVEYVEKLNPHFVIERFAGEVPPRYLSVNQWGTIRYDVVLQKIEQLLEEKNSWQGKYFN